LNQFGLLFFRLRVVETPLTLLQIEVKMGGGDAVETTHMTLGLVPEVFNAVDVIAAVGEQLGVIDAEVFEGRDIQYVIGWEGVGVDDAVGHNLVLDDGFQGLALGIRDDLRIDLSAAFEQAKHGDLTARSSSALALAVSAKVALVDFDLAKQRRSVFALQGNDLAQTLKVKRGGALVHANQAGRRTSRRSGHEMLNQTPLNRPRQTALPHRKTIIVILHGN